MPWFKVDDSFYDHPKFIDVPNAAIGLWTKAGAWCSKHLTDGVIPATQVKRFKGTNAQVNALISAGIWIEDRSESGSKVYRFHDWNGWQPTREQKLKEREEQAERQRKSRERKAQEQEERRNVTRDSHVTPSRESHECHKGVSQRPDPTRPDQIRSADADPKKSQKGSAGFDDFWAVVPRKVGKQAARRAWEKAVKVESPQVIVQKMREYRDDPNRVEEFTKHPSTWLNAGCWDDDPLPPRSRGKKQANDLDVFLDAFDTRSNHGPAASLSAERSPNGVSVPRRNFEALETRTDVVDAEGWEEVEDQKNPIDIEDNDIPF
ncbi:hypothetical protein KPA07_06190 [Corynebacterium aurimucosum]|uniref:hypothetical protein n=1 Tax=Corynebacterium aurimucosum TaxID=169292 RepID=UPI001C0F0098|nr:hypothetical protein [Corynebacterium aurimucosum]MBU5654501.1 hypothetical protein [Corynebacterium aurimucosum]